MSTIPQRREIETYEPCSIPDTFATVLARVERVGPCVRLVFAVPDSGSPEGAAHVLIGKIVVPADALPAIMAQLLQHAPAEAALALTTAARSGATAH